MATRWTIFGPRLEKARPNLSISAVAVIFASQTFLPSDGTYPVYMVFLAWISGAWIIWFGYKKRAILGLAAVPIATLWSNPLLGGHWFDKVGPEYLATHAALALVWAGCAYTFLATEKK